MLDRVLRRYEHGFGEFNERWTELHTLLGELLGQLDLEPGFELPAPNQLHPPPREEQQVRAPERSGGGAVSGVERVDVAAVLAGSTPLVDTGWPDVSVAGAFEGFEPEVIGGVALPGYDGAVDEFERRFEGDWEAAAWYCSMRSFGPSWGIYIRRPALVAIARSIAPFWVERWTPSAWRLDLHRNLDELVRTAFALLLFHEVYHHQVEVFSLVAPPLNTRAAVNTRAPDLSGAVRYATYSDAIYWPTWGTDLNLEEALAVAASFRRSLDPVAALRSFGFQVDADLGTLPFEPARRWMMARVPKHLPGYRNGIRLLADDTFRAVERALTSEWFHSEQVLLYRQLIGLVPEATEQELERRLYSIEGALDEAAWVDLRAGGTNLLWSLVYDLEWYDPTSEFYRAVSNLMPDMVSTRRWFDRTPSDAPPLGELAERVFLVD